MEKKGCNGPAQAQVVAASPCGPPRLIPILTPRSAADQHLAMALPELNDDAIAEILTLTRLPPDDPARLQRFALVCKSWRRILSDPAFHSRHRAYHRTPPLFTFFRGTADNYMVDVKTLALAASSPS